MRKSKGVMFCRCSECGEDSVARIVDNGIGEYEYWGAMGRDSQLEVETVCCDAPALDRDSGERLTVRDVEENNYMEL